MGSRIEIRIEVVGLSDPPAGLLRWAGLGGARPHPVPRPTTRMGLLLPDIERLVAALDLPPVESGGTVHLFEPDDAGVFYRVQTLETLPVVCTTQLYLDLLHYPARGREQAEVLRRQVLRY